MADVLIRNAEVWGLGHADVRIAGGRIVEIGQLDGAADIDAEGGALLPGLHDHHIHLAAEAMARLSVQCGPPHVTNEAELAAALNAPGEGWLRGIGYHESVAGMLHVDQLDAIIPHRPVRIQHRSGRMWFFNSAGLEAMFGVTAPSPALEREGGRYTGRLFDDDAWVRNSGLRGPPDFAALSNDLARYGVTGVTDMSVTNQPRTLAHFGGEVAAGRLQQNVVMAGQLDLVGGDFHAGLRLGPAKLHLHDHALPPLEDVVSFVRAAHDQGRAVASHCTTEAELVYTLAALREARPMPGDRIEHGGIITDVLLEELVAMELHVVTQPHFVAERGDQYLADVEMRDHPYLYRLGSLASAGLAVAAGSDAPYGSCDPWTAMRAAVSRTTRGGAMIGPDETVNKDKALALYFADPLDLTRQRQVAVGVPADLCLLSCPWAEARLMAEDVRMTMIGGSIVHNCVN